MGINKQEIESLVKQLNILSDAYYNRTALVEDSVFDELYDKLVALENETEYILSNSPTRRVGFEVVSDLNKVTHKKRLLSLSKTKSIDDISKFFGKEECVSSLKLDGLTTEIEYRSGELYRASTRGDGVTGEDITHSVKVYKNIPLTLSKPINITVVGESIIKLGDFNHINDNLPLDDRFKNPRNAVAGSVRNLNSEITKNRSVRFIAFDIIDCDSSINTDTYIDTLKLLGNLGFNVVPNIDGYSMVQFEQLKQFAKLTGFGIDGIVVRINNNNTYNSKGYNSKFPLGAKAFKFEDETEDTTLIDIEWSMGRTGVLTPVAVFEPVDLEGTTVERASLHNVSHIERLGLGGSGSIIRVQKSNQIIPQIVSTEVANGNYNIPTECPYCGSETVIHTDNSSMILKCSNEECIERLTMVIDHYVSRDGMDIKGLSQQIIKVFINHNLLSSVVDIYSLNEHFDYIKSIDGFGYKSAKAIIESVDKSKNTTLDKFIYGLGIPHIGKSSAKDIAVYSKSIDKLITITFDECINLLGDSKGSSLYEYINKNVIYIKLISNNLIIKDVDVIGDGILFGKTFCVTGTCLDFKNRKELKSYIENHAGKCVDSVTSKVNFLVSNEFEESSKYKKATKLGIPIIKEKELINMCKTSI